MVVQLRPAVLAILAMAVAAFVLCPRAGPVQGAGYLRATAITSGVQHSCALVEYNSQTGGRVQCWGNNILAELGNNTNEKCPQDNPVNPCSTRAVYVCASGANYPNNNCSPIGNVYGLAEGPSANHGCLIGSGYLVVACWGDNAYGQVGHGTAGGTAPNPVAVCTGYNGTSCTGYLGGIVRVAVAANHTCALDLWGKSWCWGANYFGQLGDGTTQDRAYAAQVCASGSGAGCTGGSALANVKEISAGAKGAPLEATSPAFTCALVDSEMRAMCWGANAEGALGIGSADLNAHSLAQNVCASGTAPCTAFTGVSQIHSAGSWGYRGYTCVKTSSGGMKCWGSNDWGQAGNAGGNSQYNPGDVCAPGSPRFVQPCTSTLTGVTTVGVPGLHTCAVMTDTGTYCWGYDNYDQTGDKYQINQPYGSQNDLDPQQVCAYVSPGSGNCLVPLTPVLDITGGYAHTCALIDLANETPHGVMCWGQNNFGEVGDGTTCCDDSLQEYYRARPQWVLN